MEGQKTGFPSIDRTHLEGIDPKKLKQQKKVHLSWFGLFLLINSKTMEYAAIIEGDRTYTKQKLRDDIVTMARALSQSKLKRGDKLAIVTPNCYRGIVMGFAANAIGIKVAYLNHLDAPKRIIEDLKFHEADAVVICDEKETFAKMLLKDVATLKTVVNVAEFGHSNLMKRKRYVLYDVAKMRADDTRKKVWPKILMNFWNSNDLLYLQTSGSSKGIPKTLIFGNDAVFAYLMSVKESTGIRTNGVDVKKALCVLPYRLAYGWMGIFSNIFGGNPVELVTNWFDEEVSTWHTKNVSHAYFAPPILRSLMDNTPEDADLSSLKVVYSGGVKTPHTLVLKAEEFFRRHNAPNVKIYPSYGMGEMLCAGTVMNRVGYRPGTTGVFYYGLETLVVDENMQEVKYGEAGQLLLRGATTFRGYYKNEAGTAEAFVEVDGKKWYRTNDLGSLSEDGRWTPIGRNDNKRFYLPKGAMEKVDCDVVEVALANIDIVRACAVLPRGDEVVKEGWAFVELENVVEADEETEKYLYDQCSKTLIHYQVPAKIQFVDSLPISESGKTDYQALERLC